jgi:hypothetical protein
MNTIPYTSSGRTERLVRNVHVVIGLIVMLIQLLTLDFVIWYRTTGLAFPLFIIIIGVVYGFLSSAESDEEFLRNIIEPRVDKVTQEERGRFLQFRKTTRRMVLVCGYVYAVTFQFIWLSIAAMGDIAILGLFMMPALFATVVALGATPILMIIERARYRDIRHLMDVERKDLRIRVRSGNLSQTTSPPDDNSG